MGIILAIIGVVIVLWLIALVINFFLWLIDPMN